MSNLDYPLLRPGAVARTPFGTPFFAFFMNPDIDDAELCKLRVGVKLRDELAAWEKLQRTGKLTDSKNSNSNGNAGRSSAVEMLQEEDDGLSVVEDAPTTGGRVVVGSPNFFEFVDDDDVDRVQDPSPELWPDTYSTGTADEDEDVDCEVDGFVIIHRAHATGSVFWNPNYNPNHVRPRPSPHPRGRQRQRRNHHRKGADDNLKYGGLQHQVELAEEAQLLAVWSYFADLLRPVVEMDW